MGWYNVGNNTAVAGGATVVVTVGSGSGSPKAPAVGDLVVVTADVQSSASLVTNVADSQGNNYVAQVTSSTAVNQQTTHWSAIITNALTAGTDTITVTFGSTGGGKIVIAKGCDGVSSATADKTNSGTATSTAPSSGSSGTLTQAAEAVIGSIADALAGGAPSAPSFGSFLTLQPSGSGFGSEMDELVNATTAQTASGTIVSALWAAAISTYKLTAPSINAMALPNGTQGVVYNSQTITVTGGTNTKTHAVTGGSLAGSGLSLSSAGVLSGTGGTPGTYTFTDTVTDGAGQTTSRSFTVTINSAATQALFPLPLLVEILINGAWTDITTFVYARDGINITGGGANEGDTPQRAQATLTLNNQDGRFSPNNASGAYYPYLQRNTQLRISLQNATSSSGNTYSGYRFWGAVSDWPPQSDTTNTDIYVQITASGPLRQVTQGGGKGSALTRYYGTLTGSYAPIAYWPCEEDPLNSGTIGAGLNGGSPMTVTVGTPAWKNIVFNGSVPIPVINRSTWDGTTGSFGGSGNDVYTVPGTYQWVASTSTVSVKTVGGGGGGANGGGTQPDQGGGGGGAFAANTSVAVTIGNAYTVTVGAGGSGGNGSFNNGSPIAGANGNASSFTGDSSVTVTAGGGHGASPSGGAGGTASGTTTSAFSGGSGGSQTAISGGGGGGGSSGGSASAGNTGSSTSGVSGGSGAAAVAYGGKGGAGGNAGSGSQFAQPGFNGAAPGGGGGGGGNNYSDGYSRGGGDGAAGQVQLVYTPPAGPPTAVCRFIVHVPGHGAQNNGELIRFFLGGSGTNPIQQLRVLYGTGGKLKLQGWTSAPALLFDTGFGSFNADHKTLLVSVELKPNGTGVDYKITAIDADAQQPAYITTLSGTQASSTLGNVSEVTVGPNADITNTAIGHISVQYALLDLLHVARHLNGHDAELGVDRFIRLANEQALSNVVEYNETADHWGFETGTQSWGASNAALTQSGVAVAGILPGGSGWLPPLIGFTWPTDGTHSLLATSNGGGTLAIFGPGGTSGQNILPGDTVSGAVDAYAPVALSGTLKAGIEFFTSAGASISTTSGTAVTFASGTIATLTVKAVAPATAASFRLRVDDSTTEPNLRLVYLDNVRVSPQMGIQTRKEYRQFLEEIKDLDQGILKEAKDNYGLKYRTRIRLVNQTPAVTLDYSQSDVSQPFVPEFDDQKVKNDVTVHRHHGSRVRVTLDQGGQTSIQQIGRYRKALKVVAQNDAQLAAMAAHLLNLGTVTKERYPTITVDLTRAALKGTHIATIMSAVAAVDIGDYVQVTNLPSWLPSVTTKQLVIGYTEVLAADSGGNWAWTITWNTTPEDPWEISIASLRRW